MWPFRKKIRFVAYSTEEVPKKEKSLAEKLFREYIVPGMTAWEQERRRRMEEMRWKFPHPPSREWPPHPPPWDCFDDRENDKPEPPRPAAVAVTTELGVLKNRLDDLEAKIAALTALCRELWTDRESRDAGGLEGTALPE